MFSGSVKFLAMLQKYLLNVSAISSSLDKSVKSSVDGSLIKVFSGSNKFLAMLQKYLLNVSVISSSLVNVTA